MQLTFDHVWYLPGDLVKMLLTLSEAPSGDSPGCLLATSGEDVIVRSVATVEEILQYPHIQKWPLSVSHEYITDNSFRVSGMEVRPT